ncbi:MAG: ParA family protein [Xanthomonadales bacterium]|nr:ParA family protein [Xanthomonadales bacterium]
MNSGHDPLSILTCNLKGGVGKTTVATNLAACFAARGWQTVLIDCDAQQSALQWARRRGDRTPRIRAVDAHSHTGHVAPALRLRIPPEAECLIYDAPAGIRGNDMGELLRRVQVVLIPILPSIMDLEATRLFVAELVRHRESRGRDLRIGLVANRIRDFQQSSRRLKQQLAGWEVPLLGELRDTQLYVFACGIGCAIHELRSRRAEADRHAWNAIYDAIFRLSKAAPARPATPAVHYLSR